MKTLRLNLTTARGVSFDLTGPPELLRFVWRILELIDQLPEAAEAPARELL